MSQASNLLITVQCIAQTIAPSCTEGAE